MEDLSRVPFPEKMRVLQAFREVLGTVVFRPPLTALRLAIIRTNAPVLPITVRSLMDFLRTTPSNANQVRALIAEIRSLLSLCNSVLNQSGYPSNY